MSTARIADSWQSNDKVTLKSELTQVTGSVIAIRRDSDDKRFTKVLVLQSNNPNFKVGSRVWAADHWVLGVGPILRTCLECDQLFRSDGTGAGFCPACDRTSGLQDRDRIGRQHQTAALRGNATKTTRHDSDPLPAPDPADTFKSPFG